jgi:hypothetical protein
MLQCGTVVDRIAGKAAMVLRLLLLLLLLRCRCRFAFFWTPPRWQLPAGDWLMELRISWDIPAGALEQNI